MRRGNPGTVVGDDTINDREEESRKAATAPYQALTGDHSLNQGGGVSGITLVRSDVEHASAALGPYSFHRGGPAEERDLHRASCACLLLTCAAGRHISRAPYSSGVQIANGDLNHSAAVRTVFSVKHYDGDPFRCGR